MATIMVGVIITILDGERTIITTMEDGAITITMVEIMVGEMITDGEIITITTIMLMITDGAMIMVGATIITTTIIIIMAGKTTITQTITTITTVGEMSLPDQFHPSK